MVTTDGLTQQVPMPICRYEIHDGVPDGPLLQVLSYLIVFLSKMPFLSSP